MQCVDVAFSKPQPFLTEVDVSLGDACSVIALGGFVKTMSAAGTVAKALADSNCRAYDEWLQLVESEG